MAMYRKMIQEAMDMVIESTRMAEDSARMAEDSARMSDFAKQASRDLSDGVAAGRRAIETSRILLNKSREK